MNKRIALLLLAAVALLTATACSHHKDDTAAATAANIRLVNGTQAASLSLTALPTTAVLGTAPTVEASGVASGTSSAYAAVTAGSNSIAVTTADSSLIAATQTIGFVAATNYSIVAYPRDGALVTLTLVDNQPTPSTGFASLNVANASVDAGSLDIYIVAPFTLGTPPSLSGISPTFSNVLGSSSGSLSRSINAGSYGIVVTQASVPGNVRLWIPSVTVASADVDTLVLTNPTGSALVNGILVPVSGAVQFEPNSFARVRVVAGLPANGASNSQVAVSVGTQTLQQTITSPSLGDYELVSLPVGGTCDYTVNVDSTPVTLTPPGACTAPTFVPGSDYTILVYGAAPAASAFATVLNDDDQSITNVGSKIRLINAAVSTNVSLSVNFQTINNNVAYGSASQYVQIAATLGTILDVTSPAADFPAYNGPCNGNGGGNGNNTCNIISGGLYSFFVLGTETAPLYKLNKDR